MHAMDIKASTYFHIKELIKHLCFLQLFLQDVHNSVRVRVCACACV